MGCVITFNANNVRDLPAYAVFLNGLCTRPEHQQSVPAHFCNYSDWNTMGKVWKDVKEGRVVLFAYTEEKPKNILALCVAECVNLEWREGFTINGGTAYAHEEVIHSRSAFLERVKHSAPTAP